MDHMYSIVDIELWISVVYWHVDVHVVVIYYYGADRVVGVTLQVTSVCTVGK